MTVYQYKNAALIDRVEITSPRPNIAQATMIANGNADHYKLEELRKNLGKLGFSTLMDTVGGHAAIQVRGLKTEEDFIEALEGLDLSHDGVAKDLQKVDDKKLSFTDNVRSKSLFFSAIFYDIGNAALGVSGIQRGRHNRTGKFTSNDISELLTGAAFAVGDVLMTFYGKDRGDEELQAAEQGLKKHLHKKGIAIPEGDNLNPDTLHQSGLIKATDRWLRKHIGSVKCLTELTGGLLMIHAGRKAGNFNRDKIIAGSLLAGAWGATFLLEKPRGHKIFDGSQKTVDGVTPPEPGIIDKIIKNPRGWIASPLAMGNNLFNLKGAYGERKEALADIAKAKAAGNTADLAYHQGRQHDYLWNVLTACSFLVANGLFGVSGGKRPKETEDDKRVMDDLVLLAANVLAKQSDTIREASIAETAAYVATLAHVNASEEQVANALREKVAQITQSGWVGRAQTANAEQASGTKR